MRQCAWFLIIGSAVLTHADAASFSVIGSTEVNYIGAATNETVTGRILNEGSLRKVGAGDLALPLAKLSSRAGSLDVIDGTVTATSDGAFYEPADAPAALLSQAAFWVEANTNVITFVSNAVTCVSQWLDVREPNPAGPYQYRRAVSSTLFTNAYPTLVTSGAGLSNNLSYVYFGGYHSLRWMEWQNAASNAASFSTIRNVFIVHGAHNSYGWLLGSKSGDPADFHINSYGDASTGLDGAIWSSGEYMHRVKTGRTWLDRQRIDGTVVKAKAGYQLLEVEVGSGIALSEGAYAGNFFNDRNISSVANARRQGGDRLCEVLIYTNRLTETERLQVEQYLWQKWLSAEQDAPGLSVAEGRSASLEVTADTAQALRLSGDGTLVKSGAGILRTEVTADTPPFNGTVRLDAGRLDMRLPTAVRMTGGYEFNVGTNFLMTIPTNNAGRVIKSGEGELVTQAIPDGITRVSVEQGTLRFVQPVRSAAWPTNTAGVIPNPSFEFGATHNFNDGETYGGWTAYEPAGSFEPNVFIDKQWLAPYPAPDGDYMLFLKGFVHVETTLTLPAEGVYVLSFQASARNGEMHEFDILIDGTNRVATVQTAYTKFQWYRYRLPWLAAGAHALRLQSVGIVDKTSALDNFHVDLLSLEKPLNVMSNASFECVAYTASQTETNAPADTGWTFTTSPANTNLAVIAAVGATHCLLPDYGRRILYIQNQGAASTLMTFPETGQYQLSFNIAHCKSLSTESYNRQSVAVTVDGVNVAALTTNLQTYVQATTAPFSATAGVPVTLTLTGTSTGGTVVNNRILLIDEITAKKYGTGNLIQNGGFEAGAFGWNLIYNAGLIPKMYAGVNDYAVLTNNYGTLFFEGSKRLQLTQTGLAKQSVAFVYPGTYRLAFHAISRVDSGSTASYGENPIAAWVGKDGITNRIGYVEMKGINFFRRHEFYFNIPVAGSYEIGFQGQDSAPSGDKTTLIDGVSVEKADLAPLGAVIPKNCELAVAGGARLNLNFMGTNTVDFIRYNGALLTGLISAQTHPEFVSGIGAFMSPPKGTLIRVR